KEGTRIQLIKPPRPGLKLDNEKMKLATFKADKSVVWDADGASYSLSGLCKAICEKLGGSVGTGAFAGPDYWAILGEGISLSERARKLDGESEASVQAV